MGLAATQAARAQGTASDAERMIVAAQPTASEPLILQVLHASDFEAGIAAVEDAPRFSSVLAGLKAQYPTNTIVLSSGDNYIPGPFFTASADPAAPFRGVKGRADIVFMNRFGVQAAAFGNHEFDDNTAQVRDLIRPDVATNYPGTLFPYLSANLDFRTDSSLTNLIAADGQEASTLTNKIAKSAIITVAGHLIGVVGATTTELRSISSPGGVTVSTNLAADIQAAVDGLAARGVNKIIVLAHLQQLTNEVSLAGQLRDVDVIIAGGSHTLLAKPGDRLRAGDTAAGPYPLTAQSAQGEPILIVNTDANYKYVGRLVLQFDAQGRIQSFDPVSGAYATDAQGVLETGNLPPDPVVAEVAAVLGNIIDQKDAVRFGRTLVYLNGLRASVRSEESNLGSLTADANLAWGQKIDPTTSISLKNGGGIRDSIGAILSGPGTYDRIPPLPNPRVGKQAGEISQLDIENALRFNNGLSLITLTAQQLRDAIEWSVAGSGTPGQFPQVSGLWFSYDPTQPPMTYTRLSNNVVGINHPGQRLRSLVAVNGAGALDLVVENGQLVGDPQRAFRMVTLDFLAGGGDTYYPLTLAANRLDLAPTNLPKTFTTDGTEQKALADYLAQIQVYGVEDGGPALDQRIQNISKRVDAVTWPAITAIRVASASPVLEFTTLPGKSYRVEAREAIQAPWQPLHGPAITGDGRIKQVLDANPSSPHRFYRVVGEN